MDIVLDNSDRRAIERRQLHFIWTSEERRLAERRSGGERRYSLSWMLDWFSIRFMLSSQQSGVLGRVPVWMLLAIVAIVFIMVSANQSPVSSLTSPEANALTLSEAGTFETDEIIITEPTDQMTLTLIAEGYKLKEILNLKDLGFVVTRLQVPVGVSVSNAVADLRQRYPDHDISVNNTLTLAQ